MKNIYSLSINGYIEHYFETKEDATNFVFNTLLETLESYNIIFDTKQQTAIWEALKSNEKPIAIGDEFCIKELPLENCELKEF